MNERVRAIVFDVKKIGSRVRILLSRTHPDFVRRLFELEVPEIAEDTIEIKALAREPGHRTKISVASSDPNVDCVGACVGVRGSRIKNIVDELNGEKIDIIRWSDEPEVLLPNAERCHGPFARWDKNKTIPAEQPVLRSLHLAGCPIIQIKLKQTTFCTGSGSGMKKFLLTGAVSHSRLYQRSENQKNKVYLDL